MRRIKTIILFLAAIAVLAFSSCTSLSLELKAQNEGVPSWVYLPEKKNGRLSFVGSGTDADYYRASLKAFISIADQLASYLGAPLTDDQYRELTSLSTIRDYSLSIQDRASKENPDGTTTVYLLATGNESKLSAGQSSLVAERDNIILEIQKKADAAQTFYQTDRDIDAVKRYLDASALVVENGIDTVSASGFIDKACSILERSRILLENVDEGLARCTVHVRRKNRFVLSDVAGATIKASFQAFGINGKSYESSYTFASLDNGRFEFISPNDGLLIKGSILFEIDLGDSLKDFASVMSEEQTARITSILESKKVSMEYELVSPYDGRQIVLSVTELDELGDILSTPGNASDSAVYLAELLAQDGISVSLIGRDSDDDQAFESQLSSAYPFYDYVISARVGIEASVEDDTGSHILANGSFEFYRRGESAPLFQSGTVRTAASGLDALQAAKEAFRLYADAVRFQIRDCFFFF